MGILKGQMLVILVGLMFGIVENSQLEDELEASFDLESIDGTSPMSDDDWLDFVQLFDRGIRTDGNKHDRERRAVGSIASSSQFFQNSMVSMSASIYPQQEPVIVVEEDDKTTVIVLASVFGGVAAIGGVVAVVVVIKVVILKTGGKVAAGTIMVAPAT